MNDPKPVRTPWHEFPDVILHAPELAVKKHEVYAEAKAGDSDAAFQLVQDTISLEAVEKIIDLANGRNPLLASAHAFEKTGIITSYRSIRRKKAQQQDDGFGRYSMAGTFDDGYETVREPFRKDVTFGVDLARLADWLKEEFTGQKRLLNLE